MYSGTRRIGIGPSPRLAYLDNLKVALVAGVISVHVAITYGMHGSWYLASYDRVAAPLRDLLTAIGAIGWLFAMGLFFLISGWLSAPSLGRKGPGRFMRERLFRLGLPLVAYTLFVGPVLEYASVRTDGGSQEFWPFVSGAVWGFDPGPTWFLEALLVFSAVLAAWYALSRTGSSEPGPIGWLHLAGRHVAGIAVLIAIASFATRLFLPLGSDQFHLQLPVFPQYAILFAFGAAGARRGWFDQLPRQLTRRCGIAALAAVLLLPVALAAGGLFSGSKEAFSGGWHWQALAAGLIEGTLATCACLWVLALFQRRFAHQGRLTRQLGNGAYGAFLLHPPVIVGLALAVQPLVIAAVFKLAIVLCVGIAASFGLAMLVTRIRPVAQVIGATSSRLQARVALPAMEHHRGRAGAEPATRAGARSDAHTAARPGRERAAPAR